MLLDRQTTLDGRKSDCLQLMPGVVAFYGNAFAWLRDA